MARKVAWAGPVLSADRLERQLHLSVAMTARSWPLRYRTGLIFAAVGVAALGTAGVVKASRSLLLIRLAAEWGAEETLLEAQPEGLNAPLALWRASVAAEGGRGTNRVPLVSASDESMGDALEFLAANRARNASEARIQEVSCGGAGAADLCAGAAAPARKKFVWILAPVGNNSGADFGAGARK